MIDDSGPRLVDTGRGYSVVYKSRHLYSRYNPENGSVRAVMSADLRPETLFLCISPVLGYGLAWLLDHLPPESFVLALESDQSLMALSAEKLERGVREHPRFRYIRTSSTRRVLETIDSLTFGPFRRCVRIDLSAGASLDADFYAETTSAIDEYISRYWKNRLTLMRLGRNYARNLYANTRLLPGSLPFARESVQRSIFVAGAGPSLEGMLAFIREHRQELYVLAVDAACPVLSDGGIRPDALVLVESQYWIGKAFTGFAGSRIPVFADLTARPDAVRATGGPVTFFLSAYAQARFISRFRDTCAPLLIPPLGSVGLVALHLARLLAAPGWPILSAGLDFSWTAGFTHARGAPPVRDAHSRANRLCPAPCSLPSCADGVFSVPGKDGKPVYTDPPLSGYAALCAAEFSGSGISSLAPSGLPDGLARMSLPEAAVLVNGQEERNAGRPRGAGGSGWTDGQSPVPADAETVARFLDGERSRILELRSLLTGGPAGQVSSGPGIPDIPERIQHLTREMDCLWLHFPDGYRGMSDDTAFLKRVRIELEYLLKTIERQ